MLVLGIESSCDETGFAVVKNGEQILSNIVASQEDLHASLGGVMPELACRRHIDVCIPLLNKALDEASVTLDEIDLIAVTHGPGLVGALLIGVNFAKGLVLGSGKPFVGVNHIEAHLYSALMHKQPPLPSLGVVLSGGHTSLILVKAVHEYHLIGHTQDDAVGEAFDKVARLLGLPYPGGPYIERLAEQGDPNRFPFKAGHVKKFPYNFSFSGLKTAVLYLVKGQNAQKESSLIISEQDKKDVAASFQRCAFSDIVSKSIQAARQYECKSLLIGGGVSQNRCLREMFEEKAFCPIFWPPKGLCLDNAAMIAGLGYHKYIKNGRDSIDLEVITKMRF
ncbi:MAG: tRNA (adenosine(37)-N6)-threonylcarbamoyltransferase complex transferase subunit TsaD [Chlamydiales bacterium]